MALNDKKYEKFYSTTGSDADKADTTRLTKAERDWDYERATGCEFYLNHDEFAPLLFQLQQMQDELDALRTEISANKDKATFPGFGTSSTTALVGNTTTISTSQASAITTNTAKLAFPVTYHEALLGSLSFAVDKTGAGLTISNTYTEKGKSVTKSVTLTLK